MPYSFVQIEQEKSRTIQWSVAFLFLLYFVASTIIVLVVKAYFSGAWSTYCQNCTIFTFLDWPTLTWTFVGSALLGWVHWTFSTTALIDQTLNVFGARPANLSLDKERIFKNVVEEASVATGGKFTIEPWIMPTSAMNAFALQDFQGRSIIGITEGLLMRLNREQLEAVVAHEAGHVASGDCKETTVTMVLFKVFDNICDVAGSMLRFSGSGSSRRGGGGSFMLLVLLVMIVAWAFKFIGILGSMFISREREYRADALSVRLTRNPKALAEALYIIDQRWKGGGVPGQSMEAIFILSPRKQALEDHENFFADLFSTHPPVNRRIGILLDMAHARPEDLTSVVKQADQQYERAMADVPKPGGQYLQWMAFRNGQWLGPFSVGDLRTQDWLKPDTMVKRLTDPATYEAASAPGVGEIFSNPVYKVDIKDFCPRCHVKLTEKDYEGVPTLLCLRCGGHLVSEQDVLKIIARREATFDAEIKEQARVIREQIRPMKSNPFDQIYDQRSIACPACLDPNKRMTRRFVSPLYPVEIDRCKTCGRVWFDKDELEVLQCLYEQDHPVQPATPVGSA
jgi:heat shock protein HtpX